MDPSLVRFVWRHSRRAQLSILVATLATLPLLYLSLEIPKTIVNRAIQGEGFPRDIMGVTFERVPFLLTLCGLFLATVVAINALKWIINVGVGMCGERMLRRLRYLLFGRALRFPPERFRATGPGELVQTIIAETEPLGGFIGELISTPALQGGMLVVYLGFIFAQDPLLGLAAIAFIPVQAVVIPRMQRRVVRLNRERAANQRRVAEAISEPVTGFDEVIANGAGRWRLARLSALLHMNTAIRSEIYRRKFTIKLLSNFLNQLTPFFFYSIGGWLVIIGRLEIGSLVAVLAAYKDIAKPWRELLNYYQRFADFRGRYDFVVESFSGEDVMPEARLLGGEAAAPLSGALLFEDVEGGPAAAGLAAPRLAIPEGAFAAVTSGPEAAQTALLRLAAGLDAPARGRITLGGRDIARATLPEIGAAIGHVAAEPAMLRGSIRENLLYGLYRSPPRFAADARSAEAREARMTGALEDDPAGDWVDYEAAGAADKAALDERLVALAAAAGMGPVLVDAALGARLDAAESRRWEEPMVEARFRLADALAAEDLADAVAPWDRAAFNPDASLRDNILFAAPADPEAQADETEALLRRIGAAEVLAETGWTLAGEFAEIVATLGRESAVLDSLGGYARADVLAAADLTETHRDRGLAGASPAARRAFAEIAAAFVPARDRFEIVDAALEARILAARERALTALAGRPGYAAFDGDGALPGLTVSENMLGGPRRHARRSVWRRLDAALRDAAEAAGLGDALLRLGLDAPAGAALGPATRRRIGLARALLKRPRVVIIHHATAEEIALARNEAPAATLLVSGAAEGADLVIRIGEDGALETAKETER